MTTQIVCNGCGAVLTEESMGLQGRYRTRVTSKTESVSSRTEWRELHLCEACKEIAASFVKTANEVQAEGK